MPGITDAAEQKSAASHSPPQNSRAGNGRTTACRIDPRARFLFIDLPPTLKSRRPFLGEEGANKKVAGNTWRAEEELGLMKSPSSGAESASTNLLSKELGRLRGSCT
jgi:hypothetical protein